MSADVLILTQTGAGTWAAESLTGVPRVAPAVIVLAGGGAGVQGAIDAIRAELRTILVGSAPKVTVARITPPPSDDPRKWNQFVSGNQVGVVALVCPAANVQEEPWHETFSQQSNWSVLPIFPKGANPSTAFASSLSGLNALFWTTLATECVPAILAHAGLTTTEQRVFISYRRIETQALADQLFDALTHDGFDVFVDRFTVPPGVDFQRRLEQDLTDKSTVILLESAGVPDSKWTQHEIDFAKRHRLGLASLMLPSVSSPLPSIDKDYRLPLEAKQFEGPSKTVSDTRDGVTRKVEQWGALKSEDLANVVLWIKAKHDAALFRRRTYLRDSLNAALGRAATLDDSGFLVMTEGPRKYAFWITTRSADVADFEITHPRTLPPDSSTGVIVGLPAIETARQLRLTWLSSLCGLVYVEEDDLAETGRRIKAGTL